MTKEPRKSTPRENELSVLDQSRRRCALCFWLKGDLTEKHGQLAHLDDNPANAAEDNLAFLCIEHHSLYDSTTSQHKNYTLWEVKAARDRLYQAITRNEHTISQSSKSAPYSGSKVDRQTFRNLAATMERTGSIDFLRANYLDVTSFDLERLDGIPQVLSQKGPEYEFIAPDLEQLRVTFREAGYEFMRYVGKNTFVVGSPGRQGVPREWEYEQPERFHRVVKELHALAEKVCESYDNLIRSARKRLLA